MGYETKIFVVQQYTFKGFGDEPIGMLLAQLDLCKCGGTDVAGLISSYTKSPKGDSKPTFALHAFNPDRQQEAVELLREIVDMDPIPPELNMSSEDIQKLSNDIEDGVKTTDCYGDYFGVIPIAEFIEALKRDVEGANNSYRRFQWALALLTSIHESYPESCRDELKVVTYGH